MKYCISKRQYSVIYNKQLPTNQITIRPTEKHFLTTEIRREMRKRKRTHKKKTINKNNTLAKTSAIT